MTLLIAKGAVASQGNPARDSRHMLYEVKPLSGFALLVPETRGT
jgi:hypothetical protein